MSQHKLQSILLDSNLLLLLLIGRLGHKEVENFKKTRNFTTEDAQLLENHIKGEKKFIITPHVVAETSNLIDWLDPSRKAAAYFSLSQYLQQAEEIYEPSKELIQTPVACKLGITDAALFQLTTQRGVELVTADLELYHWASNQKASAVNFHHLRHF